MIIYLNEKQLAERQQRSIKTIRNQRVSGDGIPFVRMGRSVRYRLDDVEAWENARRFTSTSSMEGAANG